MTRSESAANLCLASRVAVRQSFQSARVLGSVGIRPGELSRRMAAKQELATLRAAFAFLALFVALSFIGGFIGASFNSRTWMALGMLPGMFGIVVLIVSIARKS